MTITGPGSNLLTLTAGVDSRHLQIDNPASVQTDVAISGMTLTGGDVFESGGAVSNDEHLVLRDMRIVQNSAFFGGGGVYNSGTLTVENSDISQNEASPSGGNGGGIQNIGSLQISGSTINDNEARYGGGIRGGDVVVISSTLSGNEAGEGGDALYIPNGQVTLDSVSVLNSRSGNRGAIFVDGGQLSMTNSTVSGNYSGAGLHIDSGSAYLRHVTITGSSASNNDGRGILVNGGFVTVTNSLVAGNHGAEVEFISGGLTSDGYNLFGHAGQTNAQALLGFTPSATDITGTSDGTNPATLTDIVDTTLADNGGPTLTHALPVGSPAMNGGDPNALPLLNVPPFDQRGAAFPRVIGGRLDIGAIEQQESPSFVVTTAQDVVDVGDFQTSLREAVAQANLTPGVDTVTFDAAVFNGEAADWIRLQSGALEITEPVVIDGRQTVLITGDVDANDTTNPDGTTATRVGQDNSRIFDITHLSGTTEIRGLTLTGGYSSAERPSGPAIWSASGVKVVDSNLVGNSTNFDSTAYGGAIRGEAVTIERSKLTGNRAWGGGAVFGYSLTISESELTDNFSEIDGGAIWGSNVVVDDSTVAHNSAYRSGGGIIATNLTLSSSTVSGNETHSGHGGILTGSAAIHDSTIVDNYTRAAYYEGGGITAGSLSLTNSIVAGNRTSLGSAHDINTPDTDNIHFSLIGDNSGTLLPEAQTADANGNLVGSSNGSGVIDPMLSGLADNGGLTRTMAPMPGSPVIDAGNSGSTSDQRGRARSVDQLNVPNATGSNGADMGAVEIQEFPSLIVNTSSDTVAEDGATSLREALILANGLPGADTITFDPSLAGTTIGLAGTELSVADSVTIDASSLATGVIIDAQSDSRVISVTDADLTIRGLTITGGHVTGVGNSGAGIQLNSNNTLTIDQSTIVNNSSGDLIFGAGIYLESGSLVLTNSTVSGNATGGLGGAIFARPDTALFIDHSTITGNSASISGTAGIETSGTVTINNSIVSGNVSDTVQSDLSGTVSGNYNLIGASVFFSGTGNIVDVFDPGLAPLAFNGGLTPTHALLPDSPALNAGDPNLVAGQDGVPQFDQRGTGFDRVSGSRLDIGAFEWQQVTPSCDFDGDLDCDLADIDAVITEIAAATNSAAFDLTGDGLVNLSDRDQWLADAGTLNLPSGNAYLLGDANLDGVVDGQDFITWNSYKFQSTGKWSQGDWNADGITDGQDFIVWNNHKFQSADTHSRAVERERTHDLLLAVFDSELKHDAPWT